jgi:hypothetical protein
MHRYLAIALVVCAFPLFATEPNPSKKQTELIEQLLALTGAEKTSHAILDYYVEEMYKGEIAAAQGDPAALEDAKKDEARLRELMGQLNITEIQHDVNVRVYAKYLNEADLENLVAFYKTPSAQKYIAAVPQLSREVMQAGAEKIGPRIVAIMQQVQEEREQRHPWKRTMSDIRSIATAVEAFSTDQNKYPQASELKKALEPTYMKELPVKDGWGNDYFYVASPDGEHYRIASAGSDGVFAWDTRNIGTPETKGTRYSEHLEDDIIYQDGEMLQAPAASKPRPRPQPASAAQPGAAPPPEPRP